MKKSKKFFLETYGCQMNFSDSEIITSILTQRGYNLTIDPDKADIVFINTCSIRANAEERVKKRLQFFKSLKKRNPALMIGLLGCMANRTKTALGDDEHLLDLIAGPDAYRDLPFLIEQAFSGQKAINTILSEDETYADITPVRRGPDGVTAFISIMRGCENYCSYCVVPFTRGRERSRDSGSIVAETRELFNQGYREVTLLGQNVNSYQWGPPGERVDFTNLLEQVAGVDPFMRIRFATSHPKDIPDALLHAIAEHDNICKSIHLPAQSGSNHMLALMNRNYTREQYMDRIRAIREIIPGCSISTDIITGFCNETEEDHRQTLSLMEWAKYDFAYMFKYSERPQTRAAKTMKDNIAEPVKKRRLNEIIDLQQHLSFESNKNDVGKMFPTLIEGESKRSKLHQFGRNTQNKVLVFPKTKANPGTYVNIRVTHFTSATLLGEIAVS